MVQRLAVFDIDGVLADNRHRLHHIARRPKDWDSFFAEVGADLLLVPGLHAVQQALAVGWTPVYVSGRPERCRPDTVDWLARFGFPAGDLLLRADDDRRPAVVLKHELINSLQTRGVIVLVVDDDQDVIESLAAAGHPTHLADWLPADPPAAQQESLFDALRAAGVLSPGPRRPPAAGRNTRGAGRRKLRRSA